MQIDGKSLSNTILNKLQLEVEALKKTNVTPTLAVILIGDNPASLAYIKQKQKAAESVGITLILHHKPHTLSARELEALIHEINLDSTIHGLIIQRPVPDELGDVSDILNSIAPSKDVDGFLPNTQFDVPVALAVEKLLHATNQRLEGKQIVIIGRGSTAGSPIFAYFNKLGYQPNLVHSQTQNPDEIIKSADIVISCVGKKDVLTANNIKHGAILISVGIWRDENGKLHGDYNESDIENIASFYTPTPGGVGPVNVASLMQNVVNACRMK